ncbi:hypothetical protein EV196_101427 [Mariniflexile fucanivorans]|uniref:Secreted protein n=1 Tax=Mariniflexile fucanivorans TaxID=264023 RepID=A0A4R1RRS8_9FLAO|nr:SIMPL domain-containing protein [Mariniflexile fucanivorans]TCL68999.1 hypothetical protein EV196_101427 [Mariniflexile fucanivorans]
MKLKTSPAFLFLSLTAFISFSQTQGKNFIDQPYIEVTGQIETEIIPNEIYINIILNENDKRGKVSVEDQENQMISILKSLNIDMDHNFSIIDFDGYYKRKVFGDNEVSKIKRYELIVKDGKTLGKVYEALDRIDLSNISIIKVSHSEIEKFKREAKIEALKVAKEKAKSYAEAINQNIGKALFIQETNSYNNSQYENNLNVLNEVVVVGYGTNKQEKIQDLKIKTITITASVMAKFILN